MEVKKEQNEGPRKEVTEDTMEFTISDKLTLIGIIVTILVTGIYPFIQKPVLDYHLIDNNIIDNKFDIEVINRGLGTANDVIISLKSDNGIFKNLSLEPIMNNTFYVKKNMSYIEVDFLPPTSKTLFTLEVDNHSSLSNDTNVTVYIRSQESVGIHDGLIKIIFYISLSIIYGFISVYLAYWHKLGSKVPSNWKKLRERKFSIIGIFVIILSYIFIFTYVYLFFNKDIFEPFDYSILFIAIVVFCILVYLFTRNEIKKTNNINN